MVNLFNSGRAVTVLGIRVLLLFYLCPGFSTPSVFAEIGNCHSYVYWRLCGKEESYVGYNQLVDLLKKKLYRPSLLNCSSATYTKIKTGDVIIFGGATGHSGIALNDRGISHMRGTQNQSVDPSDGSLYGKGGYYQIPTWWLSKGSYCDDIRNNEMAHIWYHQGASKHAIKQKFRERKVGFYEQSSTIGDIYKRFPKR